MFEPYYEHSHPSCTHLYNGQVDVGLGTEDLVKNLKEGNLELEEESEQLSETVTDLVRSYTI